MAPCVNGSMHIRLHAYMAPCIYGSICIQLHAYMAPCIHSSMHIWLHAYMAPCVYGSMHKWLHAYPAPCIYSSMHIRLHAYMVLTPLTPRSLPASSPNSSLLPVCPLAPCHPEVVGIPIHTNLFIGHWQPAGSELKEAGASWE